jgi:DNA-binding beta-propeller fold protein YncE
MASDVTLGSVQKLTAASHAVRHFEYVVPERGLFVYDIDHGHRLVEHVAFPGLWGVKGVLASPATGMLYISYGGDGGSNGNGSLLAYDLVHDRVSWAKNYPTGIDSGALTPDGRRIYMPEGEASSGDVWNVIDARSARVVAVVHGGTGPHNTIVSRDGMRVFLGPRNSPYLAVASTSTNQIIRRVGPFFSGVRPFTLDATDTIVYAEATGLLGFQVADVRTGKVLFTVPLRGYSWDPKTYPFSCPSHGISLSPDGRRLYVLDTPNDAVHVFDVSHVPAEAPKPIAVIRLRHTFSGSDTPCTYDCERDGWLQTSRDGRWLYVGDAGDIVDTKAGRVAAFLPALRETRKMIEVDWRGGRPIATTSRIGIGYSPR